MRTHSAIALAAALAVGTVTPALGASKEKDWSVEPVYTKALNILSAQGYSQVSGLTRNGKMVEAQVQKDGKPMTVTVDVEKGTVDVRG